MYFLPPHDYKLEELDWIFGHELMHFKSKDLHLKYLVLFLKIVYWFNPFIYNGYNGKIYGFGL
ncbi:M56 family metallopeptidase [Clostridioides difficile]|nr:M56 family metallopeptidase [uncultured Clostridioides sp.]EGT5420214.1 hypothetical protein [Clostridioides difficile]MBH7489717.1 hypothetical protein [Clostridioides difficile]MCF8903557.1 hypothetical protein [Clostridioides difficile]MCJ1738034.1 hypothetical protein [Clostridioides difficile]MCR1512615.1 hypothetical protein [Clostridioides difficile]